MGEVGVLFKASNFGVSKMTFSIDGKELEGDATIRRMTEEIPDWPSVADPDTYVKCYQPGVTTWYIEVNGEVVFTTTSPPLVIKRHAKEAKLIWKTSQSLSS
jgi:hypothetical protein